MFFKLSTSLVISSTFLKIEAASLNDFERIYTEYERNPTRIKNPAPNE